MLSYLTLQQRSGARGIFFKLLVWNPFPRGKALVSSHQFPLAPVSPVSHVEMVPVARGNLLILHLITPYSSRPPPNYVRPEYCSWYTCAMACRANQYSYVAIDSSFTPA